MDNLTDQPARHVRWLVADAKAEDFSSCLRHDSYDKAVAWATKPIDFARNQVIVREEIVIVAWVDKSVVAIVRNHPTSAGLEQSK